MPPAANTTAAAISAETPTKVDERGDFECFGRCGYDVDMAAHLRVTDRAPAELVATSCWVCQLQEERLGESDDVLGGYLAAPP
jgi:hypothetical protein